jgi:glc operon protein GlcG
MSKLRLVECRPFFDAVLEKSTEMGVGVCSAVVNAEGHVIALERTDLGGFILPDFAIAKAFTVCAFRAVSPRFPDGVVIQKWFQERNPQLMMNASVITGGKIYVSGGCAPIFKGNEMVGAYGVCGPTSQQDDEIADYARNKAGWRKTPETDDTPESVKTHINEIYSKLGLLDRKL